jgi:2,3-diketo-5-methylthio-1-phosphopentane phosphatase
MAAVVVFDYDLSLIDVNSDTFVPLRVARDGSISAFISEGHARGEPWTALMAAAAVRLHAQGVTRGEIEGALADMPAFPQALEAVRAIAAAGHELRILSDANTVFIERFLHAHGLHALFASITTNPATWREDGLLMIRPFTPASAPHGCGRCPPNLCKGAQMDAMRLSARARDAEGSSGPVIYVGDGGGDLCPCLRLGRRDLVLAREGYPLASALRATADVAPQVVEWRDGESLQAALYARLGLGRAEGETGSLGWHPPPLASQLHRA